MTSNAIIVLVKLKINKCTIYLFLIEGKQLRIFREKDKCFVGK